MKLECVTQCPVERDQIFWVPRAVGGCPWGRGDEAFIDLCSANRDLLLGDFILFTLWIFQTWALNISADGHTFLSLLFLVKNDYPGAHLAWCCWWGWSWLLCCISQEKLGCWARPLSVLSLASMLFKETSKLQIIWKFSCKIYFILQAWEVFFLFCFLLIFLFCI